VSSSGVVLLFVRFHTLPERLILSFAFFSLLLLLLKDGRSFGGGRGGFRRLMPLVTERTTYRDESREDASKSLVLMAFSIGILSG
jgi:hypothetical protein